MAAPDPARRDQQRTQQHDNQRHGQSPGPEVFQTRDEGEVNAFISDQYIGSRSRFGAVHGTPLFRASTVATPHLQGGSIRSTIDYGGTSDPFHYQLFYVCVNGQVRVDGVGGTEQRLRPGDASFYAMGAPLDFDFHDIGFQLLALPPGRLEQIAEQTTDTPAGQVRFTGNEPLSQAAHRQWMDTFAYIRRTLDRSTTAPASAILLEDLARLLAVSALATFPNTTLDRHLRPASGDVAPAAVRRAVAYIEAHAGEPVALSDIAAAAGTTGRALQYAFRRHLGTTPMGYLRRVRLHHAHRELQAADPPADRTAGSTAESTDHPTDLPTADSPASVTVAAVAARWGYASSGRFAAAYRQAFGVAPSQTLRS